MQQRWTAAVLLGLLMLAACSAQNVEENREVDTTCFATVDISDATSSTDGGSMKPAPLNYPTSNILSRVFRIGTPDGTGTIFAIENESRQYWVTAGHVVSGICPGDSIQIRVDGQWDHVQVASIRTVSNYDIAVLQLNVPYFNRPPVRYQAGGVYISSLVHVIGFPSVAEYDDYDGNGILGGVPVPLIKHGYISGFRDRRLYIDGQFNRGFSGSPVGFRSDDGSYVVVGVLARRVEASGDDPIDSGIGVAVTMGLVKQIIEEAG